LGSDGTLRLLVADYADEEAAYEVEAEEYIMQRVLVLDDKNNLSEAKACEGNICVIAPYAVHLVELVRR